MVMTRQEYDEKKNRLELLYEDAQEQREYHGDTRRETRNEIEDLETELAAMDNQQLKTKLDNAETALQNVKSTLEMILSDVPMSDKHGGIVLWTMTQVLRSLEVIKTD
jgi:chromosome segregation ATPase